MKRLIFCIIILLGCQAGQNETLYYDQGALIKKCSKDRCTEFYRNGMLKASYSIIDGVPNGSHVSYSKDSSKRASFMRNGLMDGESILYYPNGMIKARENYTDGILTDEFLLFDSLGNLMKKSYFISVQKESRDVQVEYSFSTTGDTIFNSNDFLQYSIPNDIRVNGNTDLTIDYKQPEFGNYMVITSGALGFDKHFFVNESEQLDTLISSKSIVKVPLDVSKRGEKVIRGILINYDTVSILNDSSVIIDHLDRYFEFYYKVN